ncbi:MAG TPA: hypothetical protein VNN08_09835 [Thermoanaerobaculia bacterium]|nr:hypothetical protein [Thermoanaerobaculia bacterium]
MRRLLPSIALFLATLLSSHPALADFAQQGPKLVGIGAIDTSQQGSSVAVSADGNTAIVGGASSNNGVGAAWVWARSGGVWTQQATLIASDAAGFSQQGFSVALSADGNTAIVGGAGDHRFDGAAWIWTRSGGVWSQQGPKLVGSGAVGSNVEQGFSVALSADGNTAIVGGNFDNHFVGAAWVWTRSVGVWFQGPKLLIPQLPTGVQFGYSVSLSGDGNTALIGGINDDKGVGAAWVFTRSGAVWTQQGPKLVGSGAVYTLVDRFVQQGSSVSLSVDGNTAIVGGAGDNFGVGAAWIWTRSAGVWTQQGEKLTGLVGFGLLSRQGTSVSLSADGETAMIGGSYDSAHAGAAWVWTRSGGVWTQQSAKLVSSDVEGSGAEQGNSVSLSADGNTAIVGGHLDGNGAGAAWLWTRNGGLWTQQEGKLFGSGVEGFAQQGQSVALSADGNTAVVGGVSDRGYVGAAWVWTRSGGVWTQQAKLAGSDAVGQSRQGIAVALSADGNTAIVGGPLDDDYAGAAWIWTRSGGVWTQQGLKLVGSGAEGSGAKGFGAQQGSSVALSADGNTALVGGIADRWVNSQSGLPVTDTGAVWVWTRSRGVWTQQGSKLVGTGAVGSDFRPFLVQQGSAVALSADGNTAIVGGEGDNSETGAVWIWTRTGGVWTQQSNKLVGSSLSGGFSLQGASVALSADGNTALVGGSGYVGSVWVWTRSGGAWTQQTAKLTASDAMGATQQGLSVSLSADGNTAIVGGSGDNGSVGAVWIWKRSGGVWTQQGSKLLGSGALGSALQGIAVALSADGKTAIVGGAGDNGRAGAAWVFDDVQPRRRVVTH